jgi:hypothetical protein
VLLLQASHGFDFNKCISQGVPFMPVRTRDFQLAQLKRTYEPRSTPVSPTSEADKAFITELVSLVTRWLAGKLPEQPGTDDGSGGSSSLHDASVQLTRSAAVSASSSVAVANTAAAGAGDGGDCSQQQQQQQLPPQPWPYQELAKPQFGISTHPGFWVRKVRQFCLCQLVLRLVLNLRAGNRETHRI